MLLLAVLLILSISNASAEVYIPSDEYKGYFNSVGLYTIVGVIKNSENYPIKPIINIEIEDDSNIIKKRIEWVPILNPPSLAKEIPFKIIIPEVQGSNPIIKSIDVEFKKIDREPVTVMALYDDTLKTYDDHVTGRAINLGNEPVENIKLYAVAHSKDGELLDVGISIETLDLKPNEIKNFTMYIDPIFTGKAVSFSCFGPSEPLVINLTTTRNNKPFEIYAQSILWLYNPEFEDNNILYLNATNNSAQLPIRVPLTLPLSSMNEKFKVFLDDNEVDAFQTLAEDEMHWHLSFDYPAVSYIKEIKVTGFAEPEYKYIKFTTGNNITVITQLPKEIIPMEESKIKLAFTNSTTAQIIRDINYNIRLIKDNEILLDENRNAINGKDTLSYIFDDGGRVDLKINILNEDLKSKIETSIVVVPEFPFSILIITISMLSMIVMLRYKYLMY